MQNQVLGNSTIVAGQQFSKSKGSIGEYISIFENTGSSEFTLCAFKKVDGENIKENTFYTMKNGDLVEYE